MWTYDHYAAHTYTWTASTLQKSEEVYLVVEFEHPFPLLRHYLNTARGANLNEPKTYTYCVTLDSGWTY